MFESLGPNQCMYILQIIPDSLTHTFTYTNYLCICYIIIKKKTTN